MVEKQVVDREWRNPPVVAALEAQVARHLIYDLCTKAEQRPRAIQIMRWWDQDVVHES